MIREMTCPVCGRSVSPQAALTDPAFPFCCDRCKQVDLNRWNDGRYAITTPWIPDPDDPLPEDYPQAGADPEDGE